MNALKNGYRRVTSLRIRRQLIAWDGAKTVAGIQPVIIKSLILLNICLLSASPTRTWVDCPFQKDDRLVHRPGGAPTPPT
jgi:hypothetical protein